MTALRILELYRGRPSKEKPIYPGEYDHEDSALFGLAEYLLDKGVAVWIDEPPATAAEVIEGTDEETLVDVEPEVLPDFNATVEQSHTPVTRTEAEKAKATKRRKR